MATFYPKLSGNSSTSNGSSKFDFDTYTDNDFDIYVFEDPEASGTAGQQTAYMVFTLKNTATTSNADLTIYSITGNADFNNNGFYLNYSEDGTGTSFVPHLGPDGDNKIKSTAAATNSATNAQASACASGAIGFLGIGSTISDTDDNSNYADNDHASELNASGSGNCRPIYHTDTIAGNVIPINSYCSFVVRFRPTSQFNENDITPQITISNSAETKIIEFNGNSVNILSYQGRIGTANDNGSSADSFSASAETLSDGNTINLGYYPVGYVPSTTNKTIELGDLSSSPGNYTYQHTFGAQGLTSRLYVSGPSTTDGIQYEPIFAGTGISDRFMNSTTHEANSVRLLSECATSSTQSQSAMFNELSSTPNIGQTIYKNWAYLPVGEIHGTGNHINYRSTHYNTTESTTQDYSDYQHVSVSDIEFKAFHRIGKIINTDYPAQTAAGTDNEYFIYGVKSGFYNLLSMHQNQITFHENAAKSVNDQTNTADFASCFFNMTEDPDLTVNEPGYLASNSGGMYRHSIVSLCVCLRYNYFGSETNDAYKLPEFNLSTAGTNGIALSSWRGITGSMSPSKYESSANDFDTYGIFGTGVDTSADNVLYTDFNDTTNDGKILALKYNVALSNIDADDLYNPYGGSAYNLADGNAGNNPVNKKSMHEGGEGELRYGIFALEIEVANQYFNTIYSKGLGAWNAGSPIYDPLIKYRLAYHPTPSKLILVSSTDTIHTDGTAVDYKIALTGNSTNKVSLPTEALYDNTNDMWYREGNSTAKSSNVADRAYSDDSLGAIITQGNGEWYGAGGLAVYKPPCWDQSSASQVFTLYSDVGANGFRLKHAPESLYVKSSSTTYHKEYNPGVDFYFKIEDATYDSTDQVYRSAGRLFFHNTGDHPVYVQQVSIGVAVGDRSNGYLVGDKNYGYGAYTLLPHPNINVHPAVVGDGDNATSSNIPEWKVSRTNNIYFDQATSGIHNVGESINIQEADKVGHRHKLQIANDHTSTGNNSINPTSHYGDQTHYYYDPQGSKQMFIPAIQKGVNLDDNQCYAADNRSNHINVSFKLTPKQDSALDQGDYYAVITYSYYIDNYENRKKVRTNNDGSQDFTTDYSGAVDNLSLGFAYNDQTKLHVGRYLVRCKVQSVGNIEITDTEGDEAPQVVNLPNISIG